MRRTYLGEFEEIVLLTVAVMEGQAYGVALTHEIIEQTGRSVRLNQIHAALQRLEDKGMVKSETVVCDGRTRWPSQTTVYRYGLRSANVAGNSGGTSRFVGADARPA